jgi:hypothetical protein
MIISIMLYVIFFYRISTQARVAAHAPLPIPLLPARRRTGRRRAVDALQQRYSGSTSLRTSENLKGASSSENTDNSRKRFAFVGVLGESRITINEPIYGATNGDQDPFSWPISSDIRFCSFPPAFFKKVEKRFLPPGAAAAAAANSQAMKNAFIQTICRCT